MGLAVCLCGEWGGRLGGGGGQGGGDGKESYVRGTCCQYRHTSLMVSLLFIFCKNTVSNTHYASHEQSNSSKALI